MNTNDISSQLLQTAHAASGIDEWTCMSDVPSSGFNRIVKAQRYGRWWVLKGLKAEYADVPFYRQMLRKEFEVAVGMQHHGIACVTGFETVEGIGPCIVMEWIDGVPLDEWMPHAARRMRLDVFMQLLDAVDYIHSQQVAHRDLKPGNILVTRNGTMAKIIDFGLSDTDSHTMLKQPAGTPQYISPEQTVDTQTDLRNDIYSLGCILADMRLGRAFAPVVRRCRLPIDSRYHNVDALRRAVVRASRLPLRLAAVAAVAAIVAALAFVPTGDTPAATRTAGIIASAADGRADTIAVGTADDLDRLHDHAGNPNIHVVLTRDIDLTDYLRRHGDGQGWRPIGDVAMFRGTFDGQGHTVSGLRINAADSICTGFFGQVENAVIRNLTVKGSVDGRGCTGGLAGFAVMSNIENCRFIGDVTSASLGGGLIGYGRLLKTADSHASGTVHAKELAGGIAALLEENSELTACHAQATVASDSASAGGLIGRFNSTLDQQLTMRDCHFIGTVASSRHAAGIVAQTGGKRVTVDMAGCSSTGDITGLATVGGLGGDIGGEGLKGDIAHCQASGGIASLDGYAGGLFGSLAMCNWFFDGTCITAARCTFTGSVRGRERVGGLVGFTHGCEDCAGRQRVLFTDCHTHATTVHGQRMAGTLAGYIGALAEIRHCSADGSSASGPAPIGVNDGGKVDF